MAYDFYIRVHILSCVGSIHTYTYILFSNLEIRDIKSKVWYTHYGMQWGVS